MLYLFDRIPVLEVLMKYQKRNGKLGLFMPSIVLDLTDRQMSLPGLMNSHVETVA